MSSPSVVSEPPRRSALRAHAPLVAAHAPAVLAMIVGLLALYCALPLLLWCVESVAQSQRGAPRLGLRLVGLAVASLCVVLCGHPQVPAYAMGTAVLYALVRMWGRAGARALLAMALGVGLSGFVW